MDLKDKNPLKYFATMFAHQLDDEKRINWEAMPPYKVEEIRECGKQMRDEMWRKGYNVHAVMAYAEEYKTLSMADYREWIKA